MHIKCILTAYQMHINCISNAHERHIKCTLTAYQLYNCICMYRTTVCIRYTCMPACIHISCRMNIATCICIWGALTVLHIRISVHAYACICMYIHVYICMDMHVYTYACTHTHMVAGFIYMHMYACMYACWACIQPGCVELRGRGSCIWEHGLHTH